MSKVSFPVQVEPSSLAIGQLLASVVKGLVAKKPLAELIAGEIADVEKAIANLGSLATDEKDDKLAFINGFLAPLEQAADDMWGVATAPAASA